MITIRPCPAAPLRGGQRGDSRLARPWGTARVSSHTQILCSGDSRGQLKTNLGTVLSAECAGTAQTASTAVLGEITPPSDARCGTGRRCFVVDASLSRTTKRLINDAATKHEEIEMGPEPEFVRNARRTVVLAQKLDEITNATGWGMAGAWENLRNGEFDLVEQRIEAAEAFR